MVDSLGHAESVSVLRTEAVGRAGRLLHSHRETSAPAFVVSVIRAWDGHERDGVRDL